MNMVDFGKIYDELGVSREYLVQIIIDLNASGCISTEYIGGIAEKIVDDVAIDIHETANIDEWNNDDVRLAVGRVLCSALNIEI